EARLQLLDLQGQVASLSRKLDAAKCTAVPILTFAPELYHVLKPFQVVVKPTGDGDEFSACFYDANLTAIGANETEAVEHLKVLILDVFDSLTSKPAAKLGPGPTKQLAVLREFIHK